MPFVCIKGSPGWGTAMERVPRVPQQGPRAHRAWDARPQLSPVCWGWRMFRLRDERTPEASPWQGSGRVSLRSSSSEEEGWDQQHSQRLPAAAVPAWLHEAWTEPAVQWQLCTRQYLHLLGRRETSWCCSAWSKAGERGPLLPPSGLLSSAWGTQSTPTVSPGTATCYGREGACGSSGSQAMEGGALCTLLS